MTVVWELKMGFEAGILTFMKRLCFVIVVLILVFTISDTCYAGWREGLANIGKRIQGVTRRAIDWGAEKFKPAYKDHIVPAGQTMTDTYYDETKKIIDSPGSFAADQTPGLGDVRAADSISDKAARGDYTGAAAETASAAVDAVTPPVLGTGVAATAKGLARVAGSYIEDEDKGLPTPLADSSLEEMIKFFPNSVLSAAYLKREDLHYQVTTVRMVYGQHGQYGSYVEIQVNRESFGTYGSTQEMNAERFRKAIEQYAVLENVRQYSDSCFIKEYNNYPVVVFIHQGGGGITAYFDYSYYRFNVICSNRYNSIAYIDAGIQSLMANLGLTGG